MSLRTLIRIAALFALVLYLAETVFAPRGGPPTGVLAPQVVLADGEGSPVALAPRDGRVQVLDFWATWCGPCKKSLPALQRLHDAYAEHPKVSILGVNVDGGADDKALTDRFMRARSFDFPVVFDGYKAASTAYDVRTIPTLVIIDGRGRVVLSQVGLYSSDPQRIFAHLREGVEAALTKGDSG